MARSSRAARRSAVFPKPTVFILHCGLDLKRVEHCCERLGFRVSITAFRKEEVFAYFMRLDKPRPQLIVIRSHFRSLVRRLNQYKDIPTIVISSHQRPADCQYLFLQAAQGYVGPEAFEAYERLAMAMHQELCLPG